MLKILFSHKLDGLKISFRKFNLLTLEKLFEKFQGDKVSKVC